jgi:hypothetical protein
MIFPCLCCGWAIVAAARAVSNTELQEGFHWQPQGIPFASFSLQPAAQQKLKL